MEVIDSNKENIQEGNKNINSGGRERFVIKPVFVVAIVFLLLLAVALFISFSSKSKPANPEDNAVNTSEDASGNASTSPSTFFDDCKLLPENCSSGADCIPSTICGTGVYETCKVYDCGDTYGVYTKSAAGGVNTFKQVKADKDLAQSEPVACKGLAVEALEQKCVGGKMQLKVKLTTQGECKIEDFIVLYDGKDNQPNTFVSLGNNLYSIEVSTCGDISEITPRTAGGVPIL